MTPQGDISWLFDTNALKIAPADAPFWYTSGLIGPYYINTHFLCGGEAKAMEVLKFIDDKAGDVFEFPHLIQEKLDEVYTSYEIYRASVDALAAYAEAVLPLEEVDYISGGQRRDWFFAPILARFLEKSCLYIYNDGAITNGDGKEVVELGGAKVLNVADLLTVGSSYTQKWVPAVAAVNGTLTWSLNMVDRRQGGGENLKAAGLSQVESLFRIDLGLFDEALERGYIDRAQYDLVKAYLDDPQASMRDFLKSNPAFLQTALASADDKTRKRAEKQVAENLYGLNG